MPGPEMFAWLFGSATRPPALLALRSSRTFIVATVSTAIFTDIFVYGIVVPVLPFALTSRAAVAPADVQTWISVLLAVYGAALLLASPLFGWLADRMGSRRVPLLVGLLALGGATAMLCVGSSVGVLVAARVLQGISAAVVWVVGLALIVDTVGPEEIGTSMGYIGLSMSMGVLLAPLLGGVVFAAAGYYSVFAMAFGLIVLDIILRLAMVEKKIVRRYLGEEGAESAGDGQAQPDSQLPEEEAAGDDNDRGSPVVEKHDGKVATQDDRKDEDAADEKGNDMSKDELRSDLLVPDAAPTPLKKFLRRLPPVVLLFASRRLLSALWGSMMQSTLLTAFDSILPLFVRDTFHWNSTGAGLIFLPIVVPTFIGPAVGWASDKYGPRWLAAAGFLLACPAIILLRLVHDDSIGQKVLMCALLAVFGLCLTLALTPIMAEITYAVDAKAKRRQPGFFGKNGAYAQGYSLFNMAWAAGSMIGPLLGGLVNQAGGWGTATLILGVVSAATTVPAIIWTGGSIFKKRRKDHEDAPADI